MRWGSDKIGQLVKLFESQQKELLPVNAVDLLALYLLSSQTWHNYSRVILSLLKSFLLLVRMRSDIPFFYVGQTTFSKLPCISLCYRISKERRRQKFCPEVVRLVFFSLTPLKDNEF